MLPSARMQNAILAAQAFAAATSILSTQLDEIASTSSSSSVSAAATIESLPNRLPQLSGASLSLLHDWFVSTASNLIDAQLTAPLLNALNSYPIESEQDEDRQRRTRAEQEEEEQQQHLTLIERQHRERERRKHHALERRQLASKRQRMLAHELPSILTLLALQIERLYRLTTIISQLTARAYAEKHFYSLFHAGLSLRRRPSHDHVLADLFRLHLATFSSFASVAPVDPSSSSTMLFSSLHRLRLIGFSHDLTLSFTLDSLLFDRVLCPKIDDFIRETCANTFDQPTLRPVLDYVQQMSSNLHQLDSSNFSSSSTSSSSSSSASSSSSSSFLSSSSSSATDPNVNTKLYQKLLEHTHRAFSRQLLSQMFEIIIDFPASLPALHDLRSSLERSHLHAELIRSLSASLSSRLCHPGASTADILSTYVFAIRALRLLDDDGVMTQHITSNVRTYVRERSDCVRCITRMIIGHSKNKLNSSRHEANDEEKSSMADGEEDEEKKAIVDEAEVEGEGEVLDLSEELETEPDRDIGDDSDADAEDFSAETKSSLMAAATAAAASSSSSSSSSALLAHAFSAHRSNGFDSARAASRARFESWQPDPLAAHPYLVSRKGRHANLISLLFSLGPSSTSSLRDADSSGNLASNADGGDAAASDPSPASSEVSNHAPFLEEYRALLARRLLAAPGYARDEEVMRNERMKAHVGEEELGACEIMVHDIEQSKRTFARLQLELKISDEAAAKAATMPAAASLAPSTSSSATSASSSSSPALSPSSSLSSSPSSSPISSSVADASASSSSILRRSSIERAGAEFSLFILSSEYWPNLKKAEDREADAEDGDALNDSLHDMSSILPSNSSAPTSSYALSTSSSYYQGSFRLWAKARELHALYGQLFHQTKAPRKLVFLPELERVAITLTLRDREVNLTVNSVQLSALQLLQQEEEQEEADMDDEKEVNRSKASRNDASSSPKQMSFYDMCAELGMIEDRIVKKHTLYGNLALRERVKQELDEGSSLRMDVDDEAKAPAGSDTDEEQEEAAEKLDHVFSRLRFIMSVFVKRGVVRECPMPDISSVANRRPLHLSSEARRARYKVGYVVLEQAARESAREMDQWMDESNNDWEHTTSSSSSLPSSASLQSAESEREALFVYILSVLATFTSIDSDKLHIYLKKFSLGRSISYDLNELQLQDALSVLETRRQVVQKDGLYNVVQ